MMKKVHRSKTANRTAYEAQSQQSNISDSLTSADRSMFIYGKCTESNKVDNTDIQKQNLVFGEKLSECKGEFFPVNSMNNKEYDNLYYENTGDKYAGHHVPFYSFSVKNENREDDAQRSSEKGCNGQKFVYLSACRLGIKPCIYSKQNKT